MQWGDGQGEQTAVPSTSLASCDNKWRPHLHIDEFPLAVRALSNAVAPRKEGSQHLHPRSDRASGAIQSTRKLLLGHRATRKQGLSGTEQRPLTSHDYVPKDCRLLLSSTSQGFDGLDEFPFRSYTLAH